jgi:hypothetical protein
MLGMGSKKVMLTLYMPWEQVGKLRYSSTQPWLRNSVQVNTKLHVPDALLPEVVRSTHWIGIWVGFKFLLDVLWEDKNFFPIRELKSDLYKQETYFKRNDIGVPRRPVK